MIRNLLFAASIFALSLPACSQSEKQTWRHLSTANGDLEVPNNGNQQTALLIADLDKDGVNDFVVTERTAAPAVVWYRKVKNGWEKYVIESSPLQIEAGSTHSDIDGDGDMDVVFGGDVHTNQVWWWENPFPDYDKNVSWQRYTIKSSGAVKHHDQLFGDFDGDGADELVFWNQNDSKLILAEIPDHPKESGEWDRSIIYEWSKDSERVQRGSYPDWKLVNEHEGLAKADIDGDGKLDIVGGGRWFKHIEGKKFQVDIIDDSYSFTRVAVGDFIEGSRPEVVLVAGDGSAPLMLYQWVKGTWKTSELIHEVVDGHSIAVVDFNHDGHLDIFNAEMGLGNSPNPKVRLLLGDGKGNFEVEELLTGFGLHESLMADLDGDGDLDILGKPYSWKTPRLDIWLNETVRQK